MKKTPLLVALLFLLAWAGHAQCIRTAMFPFAQVASNNLGIEQVISTNTYSSQYSQITNLVLGKDYVFTCKATASGEQKYITVTNLANAVIVFGSSPLTVEAISAEQVRVHYADNAACESTPSLAHTTTIQAVVDCIAPVNLNVAGITTTNAVFSWEPSGDEEAWQVVVVLNGAPAPTATTTGTDVTVNPTYTHTSLASANKYQFYVRANCGSSFSPWNGPLNFVSACDPINLFYENFDTTTAGQLPICWAQVQSGAGSSLNSYARVSESAVNSNSPSRAIQLYSADTGTEANLILVAPEVANLAANTHRLRFYAKCATGTQSLQLGTINNSSAEGEFTPIETIELTASYTEYYIDYTGYLGTNTFIAIRHNGAQYASIYIDDLRWEPNPVCSDVSQINVPAENITASTATVYWTANGDETEWDVVYGPATVTDPSTLTPISPAPTTDTTGTEVILSGLTDNTEYKVWVRSVCSANDAVWIGPVKFRTPCVPFTSIDENFDTTESGAIPTCWSAVKSGAGVAATSYVKVLTYNFHSPSRTMALYNATSAIDANIMLASPQIANLTEGTHRLKFFGRSSLATGSIQIGTINNTSDNAVFTALETVNLTSTYEEHIVDFTGYEGTNTYLAFRHNTPTINTVVYIDDIIWELAPVCTDVANVMVNEVTTQTANVSWESQGTETNWQVAYGEGTVEDPLTLTASSLLTVTNFPLTDLTPNTAYKVWVRSVCEGSENYGIWIGPVSFNTNCLPSDLPFVENFETAVIPQMPSCSTLQNLSAANNFITSSPNNYGFYSTVMQYKFNCTTTEPANAWYFTKGLLLTEGTEYSISYKYGGNSASTTTIVEKLKVMYGTNSNATSMQVDLADHTFTSNLAVAHTVTFVAPTTGVFYFGFNVYSAACQNSVFIDDITIQEYLKNSDFKAAPFTFYPNPVKDVLNVSYAQEIGSVAVFNLLGQKVIEKSINSNAIALDMSSLSAGTYMVKITSENQSKTIKVIKE